MKIQTTALVFATLTSGLVISDTIYAAGLELEEIVVTARRREENLQQVPVAVTAFSPQQLVEKGITSNQALLYQTPSLVTTNFAGSGLIEAGYTIRGQGPGSGATNVGGVVAYFAEVPTHLTSIPYYDMASIQVLNGPQGTLFGRNTTGGAVLLMPQTPIDKFEGYARIQGGNLKYGEVEGAVNVPLVSDKVMLRLAGDLLTREGYATNAFTGTQLDNKHGQFYRASLRLKPTEWLDSTFIYDVVQINTHGGGMVLAYAKPGSGADLTYGPALAPFFGGVTLQSAYAGQVQRGVDSPALDTPTREIRTHKTGINTTTIDLGDTFLGGIKLKNIASFRQNDINQARDFDGTPLPIVNNPILSEYSQYWTEEFQVQGSSLSQRLQWTLGFYHDETQLIDPNRNRTQQVLFGAPFAIPGLPLTPLTIYSGRYDRSNAVFAQDTFNITDKLSLTTGFRETWDFTRTKSQQFRGPTQSVCGFSVPGTTTPLPLNSCVQQASGSWKAPTWTISVDYKLTDSLLMYIASRRGYKAGTFNSQLASSDPLFLVKPETVTDFEFGTKADWNVGAVKNRTNVALYWSNYNDIQRNVSTVVNGVIGTLARNAAKARIRGIEISDSTYFGDQLEMQLTYSYTDASFTEVSDPILLAASGGELSGVPKHKGSLTLRYHVPVDASVGDMAIGATGFHQTRWNWVDAIGTEPLGFSPEVTTIDGRADWRNIMGSNVDFGLWIKNATDKRYSLGGVALSSTVGTVTYVYSEPRTYGADIRYSFGK